MRKDHRFRRLSEKREDGSYTKEYCENGKRYLTKEGNFFNLMNNRVKTKSRQQGDPCYQGVSISENFEDYNFFVEWCHGQKGFEQEGWNLDKDILSGKNKIYSEDTCCFIPYSINSFLTFGKGIRNTTGYMGVSEQTTINRPSKYIVSCSQLNGKNKTLGRVKTPEEGYLLYKDFKVRLAKTLAETYRGLVDQRVYDYLMNFENYIDDLAIFKV